MIAYRHTLEDIQVIHLINVIDVVKDFAIILAYRDTLEHILVIHLNLLPHISHL
jgi:nucleosome binding factor SPN SPT16 subunit